jgi:23S rRNA G2445 N2-methylase RlmL
VPKRIQRRRIGYRLVSRDDGSVNFTRHAVVRHVKRALEKLERPRWEDAGEGAPVELWLIIHRGTFYCLLRATDREFRHRGYKAKHIPGSLRPTLAAALVLAGDPKPGDRFVDPLCGAGTVAIERALWGPARGVFAGDRDVEALEAARENSEEIGNAPDWLLWDAGRLPFPDYSIDKVGTNLPFGEKHGAGEDIPALYRKVTLEVGRILRPGGKAVFLTSQKRTLQRFLGDKSRVFMERSIEVRILGKRAWVVVGMKK